MKSTTRKGFTLIELLIVVVIIGILAAIAIPKFANTKEKAYVATMKSDLRNLVTAQEGYFSDTQSFTQDLGAMNFQASKNVTVTVDAVQGNGWSASATHLLTAKTCNVGVGDLTPAGERDGVPVCP